MTQNSLLIRLLSRARDLADIHAWNRLHVPCGTELGPPRNRWRFARLLPAGFRPVDDLNDTVAAASPGLFHAHVPFDEPPEMIEISAPGKLVRFNRWKTGPRKGSARL